MKKRNLIYLIVIILMISGFYILKSNFVKNANDELESDSGVLKGNVILRTGNCMPSVCEPDGCRPSSCLSEGVKRKISIREPKKIDIKTFPFFYNDNSDLIKTIESNNSGEFITTLPVGNYSIFIVENGTGYKDFVSFRNRIINEYCGYGNNNLACFVQIKKNQTTEFDLKIAFGSV